MRKPSCFNPSAVLHLVQLMRSFFCVGFFAETFSCSRFLSSLTFSHLDIFIFPQHSSAFLFRSPDNMPTAPSQHNDLLGELECSV
uniref:Uncharacterized protein n=1 Tax=Arundo donax TaxID=35708 RepID=A0A0A9G7V9_ARUDO